MAPPATMTLASFQQSLAALVTGRKVEQSELGSILDHLEATLINLLTEISALDFTSTHSAHTALLGPFLARGVLEVGLSILLARLDPFRVLVLRRIQQATTYEFGTRNNCALQWRGDFLADAKATELWSPSRKPAELTRALLGDYNDHVLWRPTLTKLLDETADSRGGSWLTNIRRQPIDSFTPQIRTRADRAYTTSSKGVHHEFVIPLSAYYDGQQIRSLLDDAIEIVATLAFVLNASPHIPFALDGEEAIHYFELVQAGY